MINRLAMHQEWFDKNQNMMFLESRIVMQELLAICRRDRAEVERLRAGGCARDQNTTQYCSEAVTLEAKLKDMHNRFVRLENDYDSLRVWCEGVEADNTTYRNEHLKALDQRNEARREILRLLENNYPTMFDAQAEKQRRNWIGL